MPRQAGGFPCNRETLGNLERNAPPSKRLPPRSGVVNPAFAIDSRYNPTKRCSTHVVVPPHVASPPQRYRLSVAKKQHPAAHWFRLQKRIYLRHKRLRTSIATLAGVAQRLRIVASMERLLLTLIVIIILGTGAALADLPGLEADTEGRVTMFQSEHGEIDNGWRRTVHGWEHESTWRTPQPVKTSPVTRVSPAVVGVLQLLTAIGALILFSKR